MSDYDMSIHTNPSGKDWADFFIATLEKVNPSVFTYWEKESVRGTMLAWFCNSMMAMYDHLHIEKISQLEKENSKLKAKLAHVERELEEERRVVGFYADMRNWHDRSERTDGDFQDSIYDDDEFLREDQWQEKQYIAGKRARQRIKERKEFNEHD